MSEREPAELFEKELRRLVPVAAPAATEAGIARRLGEERQWVAPGNRFLACYLTSAAAAVVVAVCMVGWDGMTRQGEAAARGAVGAQSPAERYVESRAMLLELAVNDARWSARR